MKVSERKTCHYCLEISKYNSTYPKRKGLFSFEGEIDRCYWHAQFRCSACGDYHHFSWLYWCPTSKELVCGTCNAPKLDPVKFWNKTYAYMFYCKDCETNHHDLLYSEFQGVHPVQNGLDKFVKSIVQNITPNKAWKPEKSQEGRQISLTDSLKAPNNVLPIRKRRAGVHFHSDLIKESEITQNQVYQQWEKTSHEWIKHHERTSPEDKGDINRQLIIDPDLWSLIGDPSGLKILYAGCGNGYLSRELARKGAKVVGIDHSAGFISYCEEKEKSNPLGCEYFQSKLDHLPFFSDHEFDLVVSNIVFVDVLEYQRSFYEISRVLKPNCRFIWSNLHPVFGRTSNDFFRLPFDTSRNEERLYVMIDRYFDTGAMMISWSDFEPLWQFDRTLSEYSKALKEAGFVIQEIIEPKPDEKTIKENPRLLAFDADRIPFFIIFDCLKLK
ncbi:MAG: class I SAM-dependent methyltransferase [Candidatus Hermodarchaeota archaeon]